MKYTKDVFKLYNSNTALIEITPSCSVYLSCLPVGKKLYLGFAIRITESKEVDRARAYN